MPYFNIVAQTNENTVVTEYEPVRKRSDGYQSEAELEKDFIAYSQSRGMNIFPYRLKRNFFRTFDANSRN